MIYLHRVYTEKSLGKLVCWGLVLGECTEHGIYCNMLGVRRVVGGRVRVEGAARVRFLVLAVAE